MKKIPSARRAGRDPLLIIAASDLDSDLYWATRFLVPDPMTYVELEGEKILLVKDLELGRAREFAAVDRVVPAAPLEDRLRAEKKPAKIGDVAALFLREAGVTEIGVPESFPLGCARDLTAGGVTPRPVTGNVFPERAVKTREEIEWIAASQRIAEDCTAFVIDRIRQSDVTSTGELRLDGEPLTSERLRREARSFLLARDAFASEIIIAGGDQACDPHHVGHGPLRAGEAIIIDVFPRSLDTRYWGDITRTVVRGRASDDLLRLYQDVHDAQSRVFEAVRPGADGEALHRLVVDHFAAIGRVTESRGSGKVGYFHGTGHGVGLDIHEAPSLGRVPSPLAAGHVITVEPGLYYPGLGGVRIEDTIVVTDDGFRNLTSLEKVLEV